MFNFAISTIVGSMGSPKPVKQGQRGQFIFRSVAVNRDGRTAWIQIRGTGDMATKLASVAPGSAIKIAGDLHAFSNKQDDGTWRGMTYVDATEIAIAPRQNERPTEAMMEEIESLFLPVNDDATPLAIASKVESLTSPVA
jgi:hypothetical protein